MTSPSFGITESNGLIFTGTGFSRTAISSSAKPNAPTSAGHELEAAGEIAAAEAEAVVRVDRLLPDRRGEDADEPGDPALQRIVAGQRAGDDHAEQREPEELVRAELEREVAEDRREQREEHHADQRAEHRARRRDAHRAAGEPLLRERVAVEARRRGGRRAREC